MSQVRQSHDPSIKKMKIAIASTGQKLTAKVDQRFGRCPYFLIVDTKDQKLEILKNTAIRASRGVGISAAQLITDQKVQAIIAGNFGPNAIRVLQTSGIKLFTASQSTSIDKAISQLKKGNLKQVTADTI